MSIKDTPYWERKRKYRPDITDDIIEYCIQNSNIMRDRDGHSVFNAIARIPPSGRILKVAYRREGNFVNSLVSILVYFTEDMNRQAKSLSKFLILRK